MRTTFQWKSWLELIYFMVLSPLILEKKVYVSLDFHLLSRRSFDQPFHSRSWALWFDSRPHVDSAKILIPLFWQPRCTALAIPSKVLWYLITWCMLTFNFLGTLASRSFVDLPASRWGQWILLIAWMTWLACDFAPHFMKRGVTRTSSLGKVVWEKGQPLGRFPHNPANSSMETTQTLY